MLFQLIITLFIILNIYFIFNLYLIDINSSLKLAKNINELKLQLYNKHPVLISLPKEINLDNLNLDHCYKNIDKFNNLEINNKINFDPILLNSNLLCNFKYSLSNFLKKDIISFKKCLNNYHIISCLNGDDFYIYLLHPKYKDLKHDEALKYSEKVLVKPYDILIIPFGWKYLQEINNKTINYHIDIDNYFTFIHNSILNKI
uniref:Cupin-like domain-containing protein n=1 Tax=viral metagenome TaxID=1070528 RepID=A0A6C0C5I2_9ZZZZ